MFILKDKMIPEGMEGLEGMAGNGWWLWLGSIMISTSRF